MKNKNACLMIFISFMSFFNFSLTASYDLSTIAGGNNPLGDNVPPTVATVSSPSQVFIDNLNNTYIADTNNHRIRWVPSSNTSINGVSYLADTIYTIAGTGVAGFSGDGGLATSAMFSSPRGVQVDSAGNIFVLDSNNNRVRKFTLGGNVSTIAGGGSSVGDNVVPTLAAIASPSGIFIDNANNIYIADTSNQRIRMIWGAASNGTYTQGNIYTIAGTGVSGFSGDGGLATSAQLSFPRSVRVDNTGAIYVADSNNFRIRKFTLGGNIATVVGGGVGDQGPATLAAVNFPSQVFLDALNNVYIADTNNNRIRMLWMATSNSTYTQGNMYTIAGTGGAGFSGDGGLATLASLRNPRSLYVDSTGIYVADTGNNAIRKFTLGGSMTTIAGTGVAGFQMKVVLQHQHFCLILRAFFWIAYTPYILLIKTIDEFVWCQVLI